MNVIVVDDERIILTVETAIVKKVLPNANIASFQDAEAALDDASRRRIDIAFLDISLKESTGLELAKALKRTNPRINVVFCTGYSEYALEAYSLYASAYLLKPISEETVKEAISQLRFPVNEQKKRVAVRCFGNFEMLCDGEPVKFKYTRTKELFAVLIDRKGALLNSNEIMATMFGDNDKGSYVRNLKVDLTTTFQQLGVEDVLVQQKGKIGVLRDKVDCDYYDYLDGKKDLFHGEYMTQYSFAEVTLAYLLHT